MKKLSAISITVLAIFLLSTSAMAWSNCKTKRCDTGCGQTHQGNHIERMAVILDLSAEQQKQMRELRATQQQKRSQMRTDLREAHQQLRAVQPGATLDVEDLKPRARAYANLKTEMLVNKIEHKQQMFNLLTPEQQEKAIKLKAHKAGCECKGCECKRKACDCVRTDCRSKCCPKSSNKDKGCKTQCKNADMDCGSQAPCKMKRCG